MSAIESIAGGCAAPAGFAFAGVHCGIKKRRPDLSLLVSREPATVAGMFTSNQVCAPPVRYCRELLGRGGQARAIVTNSGNANACTGPQGMLDAIEMAELVAAGLGCASDEVFVSSTGVIGPRLPMEALRSGVPAAVRSLDTTDRAASLAAEAILTTDTTSKSCSYRVQLSGGTVHIGGMAKGSGMIAPDLVGPDPSGTRTNERLPQATTLAFLLTDADIPGAVLQQLLSEAMQSSFNAITVDADTSTNDTVLLLANGASETALASEDDLRLFQEALSLASLDLALAVVKDGEGAQRLIEVRVTGAANNEDARTVARTVAESPLVKTAFCAGEPNWGRFMMAAGRSGVPLTEAEIAIRVNDLLVVEGGLGTAHEPDELRLEMTRKRVLLAIDLGGSAAVSATCWTCDLSEEYVRINGHYLT